LKQRTQTIGRDAMRIRTRPASATICLEDRAPTDDPPASTQIISFGLLPADDRDHLDLDTGEVFQEYNYAVLHKKEQKLISASITVRALPDDSYYQYNLMRYLPETKGDDYYFPSSIHFDLFIAPTSFGELAGNLKNGLPPGIITIELSSPPLFTTNENRGDRAPIEYGWEPDGSGLIWHNQENRNVPVEGVTFDFPVVKPRYDEHKTNRLLPLQPETPTERIGAQIALIQTTLAEFSKRLRWITLGVVALVIMIAISLLRQRIFL
jgi:hypothetical protein